MSTPQRSHDATDPDYFDSFASRYQEVLDQTLTVAGVNSTDVARYRIQYLRQRLHLLPQSILDFGCGVGLAIPFMLEAFPGSRIVGADVSADSVERARTIHDSDRVHFCRTTELGEVEFDLGYAQGVFHHIAASERVAAAANVFRALRPGGLFALIENNPWNPMTRYVVRTCPFDEGVQLLRPTAARSILSQAGFRVLACDYICFLPDLAAPLRPLERHLRNFPLGTQYLILARRDR
ncbi:MAG: methyltransferase domain-containing protein [Candidatus Dormibacteraeota bacterium]|nr:methyltransferase domain-containing protein [Candidatus Dormibacteraeota bacterium]